MSSKKHKRYIKMQEDVVDTNVSPEELKVVEATPEPEVEIEYVPEPVVEPTPEPVVEPTPEPTPEPVVELVAKPINRKVIPTIF